MDQTKILFILFLIVLFYLFFCCNNNKENLPGVPTKEIIFFSSKDCRYCNEFQKLWNLFVMNNKNNNCVDFIQIDTNENPSIAKKYKVTELPKIIAVIDGEQVYEFNDQRTYEKLFNFLVRLRTSHMKQEKVRQTFPVQFTNYCRN